MTAVTTRVRSALGFADGDGRLLRHHLLGRQWWRVTTKGRAERLVIAPVAQAGRRGPPVTAGPRSVYRLPQRVQRALEGPEFRLVRLVRQALPVAEVVEPQLTGDDAT